MAVKPIPKGYHTITPYFVVSDAEKFMEFVRKAFDGKEVFRADMPDGSLMHAELQVGDSKIMLGQASERWKPTTCSLYLYVEDVDRVYRQALQAGGTSTMEPKDEFYGDRGAGVQRPVRQPVVDGNPQGGRLRRGAATADARTAEATNGPIALSWPLTPGQDAPSATSAAFGPRGFITECRIPDGAEVVTDRFRDISAGRRQTAGDRAGSGGTPGGVTVPHPVVVVRRGLPGASSRRL